MRTLTRAAVGTVCALIGLCFAIQAIAQEAPSLVMDGSTGLAGAVAPNSEGVFFIGPDRGVLVDGQNLFHSFERFGLSPGEIVRFEDPAAVPIEPENVIARVTGGDATTLQGRIETRYLGNFFLLNPNGVFFGADADLDLGGSFYASSAAGLLFDDGELLTRKDSLSFPTGGVTGFRLEAGAGAVSAEGFAPRTLRGVERFGLIGGNVDLDGTRIVSAGGDFLLGSASGPAIFEIDETGLSLSGDAGSAIVRLRGDSLVASAVDVIGTFDAGNLHVRSGSLVIEDSAMLSATTTGQPGSILVDLDDTLRIHRQGADPDAAVGLTTIDFVGTGGLTSGRIEVLADQFVGTGGVDLVAPGGGVKIGSSTEPLSLFSLEGRPDRESRVFAGEFGPGGSIEIHADRVSIADNSRLSAKSVTESVTPGGSIGIFSRSGVEIDGSTVETSSFGGDGGNITIEAPAAELVRIKNSSLIASVNGDPNASPRVTGGNIEIDPEFLVLDKATLLARAVGGDGGNIVLTADTVVRSADSVVDAQSRFSEDGTVLFNAPDVDLRGALAPLPANLLDAQVLLAERCADRDPRSTGSFVVEGQVGVPDSPKRLREAHYPGRRWIPSGGSGAELVKRAETARRRGEFEAAISLWLRAAATQPEEEAKSACLLELAQAQETAGALGAAAETLASAKASDPLLRASLDAVSARIDRRRTGDPSRIEELSSRKSVRDEPDLAARVAIDRANAMAAGGDLAGALEVLELPYPSDAPDLRAMRATNRARIASLREDDATALEAAREAARLLQEASGTHQDVYAAVGVFGILVRAGQIETAVALLTDLAPRTHAMRAERASAHLWQALADLYRENGQIDDATELNRRSLRSLQRSPAPESEYLGLWQRARLEQTTEEAVRFYRLAFASLSRLRLGAALHDHQQAEFATTFETATLVREFVDALLRKSVITETPQLRQALLQEAQAVLESQRVREIQDYFRDECIAYQSRPEISAVPGAVSIYPVVLDDRLELLVALPGGWTQVTVPVSRTEIETEALLLREQLLEISTNRYRRSAANLFDWIIRPIRTQLDATNRSTLVFVPSGALRSIPMAALYDRERERFLIEDYAIAVAPALRVVEPRAIQAEQIQMLRAGISESILGYPALQHVAEEIASVETIFPGQTLLNENFSSERFTAQLEERAFGIVHIASHAKVGSSLEDGFVLAFDGKLQIDTLADLVERTRFRDRPVELLALSACETAVGDHRSDLGLAGIAVRAGARSTIASLWSIDDRASGALMRGFYQALASSNTSRAAALQSAQRELLSDPGLRHPAYWAPFLLIGSWL